MQAHDQSLSAIRLIYRDKDVLVSVSTHLSRLYKSENWAPDSMPLNAVKDSLSRRIKLRLDGKSFEPQNVFTSIDKSNDLLTWQAVAEPQPSSCDVLSRIYPEDALSQTVVTVVRDGQACDESLLNAQHPEIVHEQPKTNVLMQFIEQGITHIFSGADHVLFVVGLLLAGGGIKPLITIVTAFTIAHSLTLGLTALHIISVPAWFVEPAIALSIVVVAVEDFTKIFSKSQSRASSKTLPLIAFFFGLIHGCGFANTLTFANLDARLLLIGLLSFNIGVELGQGAIILSVYPVLVYLSRNRPRVARKLTLVGSVLIGCTGAIWLAQRL